MTLGEFLAWQLGMLPVAFPWSLSKCVQNVDALRKGYVHMMDLGNASMGPLHYAGPPLSPRFSLPCDSSRVFLGTTSAASAGSSGSPPFFASGMQSARHRITMQVIDFPSTHAGFQALAFTRASSRIGKNKRIDVDAVADKRRY